MAAALAGCSATPYQSTAKGWGYNHTKVSDTIYRISSSVNGFSERSRADDIALLRAADIACIRGYGYFDVINESFEQVRKISHKFITIQLRSDNGTFDARIVMDNLIPKLNAKTECHF